MSGITNANRRIWSGLSVLLLLASPLVAAGQRPTLSDLQPSSPTEPSVLTSAQQLMDKEQFHEAESVLRVYLSTNDLSADAHSMLAYALLREDKPKESLAEYTRSAALAPPTPLLLERVGQDYVLAGDLDDADKWTLRAVQMNPADAEGWYSLGRIRYSKQRFGDALSCFRKVLELSPHSVKAENNLGLAYDALDQPDAAIAAFRQAIAWQSAGPPDRKSEQPLLNLGKVLLEHDNLTEALPPLQQAAALAPKDWHIRKQLGELYLKQQDYAAAGHELETACALAPSESSLHFLLGQVYRHLGRQQEAKAQFDTVSRLESEATNPHSKPHP